MNESKSPKTTMMRKESEETRSPNQGDRELSLAKQRIGEVPVEGLRWILKFTQWNLDTLRPQEFTALAYDLRSFPAVAGGGRGPAYKLPWPGARAPMPPHAIRKLQEELSGGIEHILADPSYEWRIPAYPAHLFRERMAKSGDGHFRVRWECKTEIDAIRLAVIQLLVEVGHRLRACHECRRPFIPHRRQNYCSTKCSQRLRNRHRHNRKEV